MSRCPCQAKSISGLEQSINELQVAADADYVNQRKLLIAGIASKMPNHDVLVCNDQVGLDNDFIEAISRCFAKHVKFKRIQIDKTWPMRPFLAPVRWDLGSLDLDVNLTISAGDPYYSEVDAILGNTVTIAWMIPHLLSSIRSFNVALLRLSL